MRLRLRDRVLELEPGRPLLMGIVNASPDSFSDGARIGGIAQQVARGLAHAEAGAAIVDVGGESGATDRRETDPAEEIARVVPVIERLAAEGVLVSVDTYKPAVAVAAIEAGAAMVNDVSALRDPALADECAAAGAALVLMHTRAAPKQEAFPAYEDVMADVVALLRERIAVALERGVQAEQIAIDPGPGFSKTPAQTIDVLRRLPELSTFERPVLLAVSRKDFVGTLTGRAPADRDAGTLAAIGAGADAGAAIVRVHDVQAAADFLAVRAALREEETPRAKVRAA